MEKLNVEELIKALQCCSNGNCNECPCREDSGCIDSLLQAATDTLESLAAENKRLRENNESRKQTEEAALKQLKAALEENTRLAKQIASKNEESPEAITRAMREIKDTYCGDYDCLLPGNAIDDSTYYADADECKDCKYGMCYRALERSLPKAPKEEKAMKTVIAEKDGNAFIAHYDDFINLQESPAGYGDTPEEAKEMLYAESEGGKQ